MTELAGAGVAHEVLRDPHRTLHGAEARHDCANCGTPLQGAFCHACGQKGHLHDKLWHLVHELVEGVAHFDGRLWRTLPLLAFRPGRLSQAWIEGKRVRYVAPLHVFLFAVFLLFVIPTFTGRHLITLPGVEELGGADGKVTVQMGRDRATIDTRTVEDAAAKRLQGSSAAQQNAAETFGKRLLKVAEQNEYYGYKIEGLAYKLSFVIVPISMAILWVLMLFKRGYTLYDHGVVALYGVGFLVLMLAVASAFPASIARPLTLAALIYASLHAIVHLKGAYRISWFGAVARGLLLGWLSAIGFGAFLIGVFTLGILT